jgi:hypothetical protein
MTVILQTTLFAIIIYYCSITSYNIYNCKLQVYHYKLHDLLIYVMAEELRTKVDANENYKLHITHYIIYKCKLQLYHYKLQY